MRTVLVLVLAAALLTPVAARAQVVKNPTTVTFDAPDFSWADRYEGGYFQLPVKQDFTCDLLVAPATTATALDNLGKPATTTGVGLTAPLVARPLGCYVYKVREYGGGLVSPWSAASGPFERDPASPTNVVMK